MIPSWLASSHSFCFILELWSSALKKCWAPSLAFSSRTLCSIVCVSFRYLIFFPGPSTESKLLPYVGIVVHIQEPMNPVPSLANFMVCILRNTEKAGNVLLYLQLSLNVSTCTMLLAFQQTLMVSTLSRRYGFPTL